MEAKVGYSTNPNSFTMGLECATKTIKDEKNVSCNFLFTSAKSDIEQIVKGIQSINSSPIIGCTSSGGIIVPEGFIASEQGFAGMLSIIDENTKVGIACHEAGRNPRVIGRKIAISAIENAQTIKAPSYFYMVATPKEEEEYLMGIQDIIGRVPMFGGSAADDTISGNWKIICNNTILSDGVAVAFFYTDNEIATAFTGAYKETNNCGLITKVKNQRTLVSIDGISALKKYAHWVHVSPSTLIGFNLLASSIVKPLGIKDPLGNLTVIRHPIFGNDMGTKTTADDTITLGNKVVEGTAIIQCEITTDELIHSTGNTIRNLKKKTYTQPAAYILIHSGGRKLGIGKRIEEVHKQIIKETKNVPFIMPFTFGEYGYNEHSANICGGLMLSFTVFGKN